MHRGTRISLLTVALVAAFVLGAAAHKWVWPHLRSAVRRAEGEGGPDPLPDGTRFRAAAPLQGSGVVVSALPPVPLRPGLDEQVRALQALGYASGSQRPRAGAGVKVGDPAERSITGVMLVTDGHAPSAWLMDMSGNTLHRWQKDFDEAFPGNEVPDDIDGIGYFRRAALLPDGELLAIYEGQGLIKLDAQSNLIWAHPARAHHDLEVQADGSIFVLTRTAHIVEDVNPTEAVLEDFVEHLDADGKVLERISVLEAVLNSPYRALVEVSRKTGDLFHTNTIEVLDGRFADVHPAFERGNILLSLCSVDALVVLDPKTRSVVWALAGLFSEQHQPTMLDSGRLMVFDNSGDRGKSRVIEIDPRTLQITWEYSGYEHDFHSPTCGTAQRLPSGHTLITESDFGRAFIITPEGKLVWEYVTPNRAGPGEEFIATLFEVLHLPADTDLRWMHAAEE